MYNMLIVDDEPRIVNGLYEQFLEWNEAELEVYRAYSAVEAVKLVGSAKMDIVLTDIHMPGKSGLELQEVISGLWPRCKVIFLTGYGDFDYIQSAMRNGGVDYILKIEGDEPIFEAVRRAIARLREELEAEQIIAQAQRQAREAIPMQRKELLSWLLEDEPGMGRISQKQLDDVELPLSASGDVLLIAGRIDGWRDEALTPKDNSLLVYAVQNIAAEYLADLRIASCSLRRSELVWLIQPAQSAASGEEAERRRCETFVRDTLPDIQESCAKLLNVQLSLAFSSAFAGWEELGMRFALLRQLFRQGLGHGKEVLLFEPRTHRSALAADASAANVRKERADADESPASGTAVNDPRRGVMTGKLLRQLEWHLDSGQKEEFAGSIAELMRLANGIAAADGSSHQLVEIRFALSAMFLSYLNRRELVKDVSAQLSLEPLLNGTALLRWADAEAYYTKLSELLFSLKSSEQKDRVGQVVSAVNSYIEQHLTEPLSLDILADHVYLHPTYLSRLYKQATGVRLSDWIKELRLKKAKELLASPRHKVHEVALLVGFESARYFAKVFKKDTNLTPQEYRNLIAE